jgi:hypothetical protein
MKERRTMEKKKVAPSRASRASRSSRSSRAFQQSAGLVSTKPKRWTREEWKGKKEELKKRVAAVVNELGWDNALNIPDHLLAEVMVESVFIARSVHRAAAKSPAPSSRG